MFAQETIKVEEVARELKATQAAIGSGVDVAAFAKEAFQAHGAVVSNKRTATEFDLAEIPVGLAEAVGRKDKFAARFELPVQDEQVYLSRTHPIVEGLATYVMDTALDPIGEGVARRCGVIRTSKVEKRTTLLLVRFRYHILTKRGETEQALLAEDCQLLAFAGSPQNAQWLDGSVAEELLLAQPDANVHAEQARDFLQKVLDGFDCLRPHLNEVAVQRGEELLEQHRRVRTAARMQGVSQRVEPQLPPDVLGVYVYLPKV